MLRMWLELCDRFGIDEVLINVHAHSDMVRDFVRRQKTRATVQLVEEAELLGSAGTLRANRAWVASDQCFWVFYTDVLHQVNLATMLELHRSQDVAATLGVYKVPDPTRCGIADLGDDNRVTHFVEKPARPTGNLAFAGLLIGTPVLLDAIPDKCPADLGLDVLPQLVGRMLAYPISDYVIDIGTMENYKQAQATWPAESV
jgi:mannose-1-phosphate guanylyltransferase